MDAKQEVTIEEAEGAVTVSTWAKERLPLLVWHYRTPRNFLSTRSRPSLQKSDSWCSKNNSPGGSWARDRPGGGTEGQVHAEGVDLDLGAVEDQAE